MVRLLELRLELEIVLRAAREVLTAAAVFRVRGVKNLLNLLGVMGGGFLILGCLTSAMAGFRSSSSTWTSTFRDLELLVGV